VMACTAANIEPLIATGRQPHHPSWRERSGRAFRIAKAATAVRTDSKSLAV
jgi:hypothetical protein